MGITSYDRESISSLPKFGGAGIFFSETTYIMYDSQKSICGVLREENVGIIRKVLVKQGKEW